MFCSFHLFGVNNEIVQIYRHDIMTEALIIFRSCHTKKRALFNSG